jgi:S-DNA-T family DNA segregation ATPase FtsK/SpoIIIE
MIISLLCSASPEEVKFIMIDPKRLELSAYDGIPHLQTPVLVRAKDTPRVFQRLVAEMQHRYRLMAEAGARNIEGYNKKIREQGERGQGPVDRESTAQPDEMPDSLLSPPNTPFPYLVVIVDELADLMLVAARDIEDSIARLAQMARAAGIHLVLATQRPSVDVLTGLIKANFPARISFQVSSKTDSRTILDANGAEQLLGRGDMLFMAPGTGRITRIHGANISENEIRAVVEHAKAQAKPHYIDLAPASGSAENESDDPNALERDELFAKAVDLVVTSGSASASLIQRRLRVGYPRAARMIEMMEEDGIVGPAAGGKPREILSRKNEQVG